MEKIYLFVISFALSKTYIVTIIYQIVSVVYEVCPKKKNFMQEQNTFILDNIKNINKNLRIRTKIQLHLCTGTHRAYSLVGKWDVSKEASFFDHGHILLNLGREISDEKTYRNPITCNWRALKEELK